MLVQSLGSSSAGNAYRVSDGSGSILLEAGLPIRKIAERTGHQLSALSACLITHEHGDHSRAVKDLLHRGVPCYMSAGTMGALGLGQGYNCNVLEHKTPQRLPNGWTVLPFLTIHDAAEPLGFMLDTGYEERLLFLTDTAFSPYRFAGLTHIMVECNFVDELLDQAEEEGRTHGAMAARVRDSHMSENTVIQLLHANDLSRLKEVHLMHLSDSHSDAARIKENIQRVAGCPVWVCDK